MSKPPFQMVLPGFSDNPTEACDDKTSQPVDTPMSKNTVYVMDVHYLLYQVFHALPEIRSPDGRPIAAVYGFLQDVARLIERPDAGYLLCAFDCALEANSRRTLYPAYKANREAMPDDLFSQLKSVRGMLCSAGVPAVDSTGFEADDILATIARMAELSSKECKLVTGDKDCRQLLSDRVAILDIRKDSIFDAAALHATWSITPRQVIDFQALVGDSSDNIPGVPLVGPKTASRLLAEFDSIDNLLHNVKSINGEKLRQRLLDAKDSILISRKLATLCDSVPINVGFHDAQISRFDFARLEVQCKELGLEKLSVRFANFRAKLSQSESEK